MSSGVKKSFIPWYHEGTINYASKPLSYSATTEANVLISWYYTPGCMTLKNGDPGYPPENERDYDIQEFDFNLDYLQDEDGNEVIPTRVILNMIKEDLETEFLCYLEEEYTGE